MLLNARKLADGPMPDIFRVNSVAACHVLAGEGGHRQLSHAGEEVCLLCRIRQRFVECFLAFLLNIFGLGS